MRHKITPNKPFVLMFYGYPGAGKSTFAREFAKDFNNLTHLYYDQMATELSEQMSRMGQNEPALSKILYDYMAKQLLQKGDSILLDINLSKRSDRKKYMKLALENKATPVLVWLQIDPDTAYSRIRKRDRRKTEDKYSKDYSINEYKNIISNSSNPVNEDYVVISGKHTYKSQASAVLKKLVDLKVLTREQLSSRVVKPELVNLVPNTNNRPDLGRRNISIR
jgi:predicted kinase